jgi:hypothetical protein
MDSPLCFYFAHDHRRFQKGQSVSDHGNFARDPGSDQFTSSFMKPFFERLRPCHDFEIGQLVHVVKKCGGQFGFASGHSANSFGIAMFTWLLFAAIRKAPG